MLAPLTAGSEQHEQPNDQRRRLTDASAAKTTPLLKLVTVKNPSKLFAPLDKVQSNTVDSPLRHALNAGRSSSSPLTTTTTSGTASSTPLLAASLSTPPVTTRLISRDMSAADASSNAAVDLSQRRSVSPPEPEQPEHHDSSTSAHAYANLLLQLRERVVTNGVMKDINSNTTSGLKLTAAARKEKLRLQPCFQCPVCKKRFQRHIAMNAHFQNEHIGSESTSGGGKKFCKLCHSSHTDILSIRQHLFKVHSIDLENPVACLVEAEPCQTSQPANQPSQLTVVKIHSDNRKRPRQPKASTVASGGAAKAVAILPPARSDDEDSSSSSGGGGSSTDTPSSSCLSSPEQRLSPALIIKQELPESENATAADLTLPKLSPLKRSASPLASAFSPAVKAANKKRKHEKKVIPEPSAGSSSSEPSSPSATSGFKYQCHHCLITFPNQTLYFLHRGFHSSSDDGGDPWKCNVCGQACRDMYDFNTHLVSVAHN